MAEEIYPIKSVLQKSKPSTAASQILAGPDAIVAVEGRDRQSWLASADVIVSERSARRGVKRWAVEIFQRYPGCAVAVGHRHRQIILAIRDGQLLLIRSMSLDETLLAILGVMLHDCWASVPHTPFPHKVAAAAITTVIPGVRVRLRRWGQHSTHAHVSIVKRWM